MGDRNNIPIACECNASQNSAKTLNQKFYYTKLMV